MNLWAVNNGPQALYGLSYSTVCWHLDGEAPFHEELGYWLWDKDRSQAMRCFLVPRGVLVNAGHVEEDSRRFRREAELGSHTDGALSNRYLDDSYKTKRYSLNLISNPDGTLSYPEDTELWTPVEQEIFHHTDQNTLSEVG